MAFRAVSSVDTGSGIRVWKVLLAGWRRSSWMRRKLGVGRAVIVFK